MEERKSVYQVTSQIIQKLEERQKQDSRVNATLAALRNTVGKTLMEADQVWPFLFENLPKSFLGTSRGETAEEFAIFTTLQIYAACKQGSADNVTRSDDAKKSIGASLKAGRNIEDSQALDRRFSAMLTSVTMEECVYHMRHLIKIVRAKNAMTINYGKLANDLFWLQKGKKKEILFQWAADYYSRQSGKDGDADPADSDNKEEER